jgi:hypothetical protein
MFSALPVDDPLVELTPGNEPNFARGDNGMDSFFLSTLTKY